MNDIMKIVHALEDSNILLKAVTKTIKNETTEQKGEFLSLLLGTLGASLLGNLLTGKGILRAGSGLLCMEIKKEKELQELEQKKKGIIRINQDLMVFIQEITYLKQ